jgi:hypothetical protein
VGLKPANKPISSFGPCAAHQNHHLPRPCAEPLTGVPALRHAHVTLPSPSSSPLFTSFADADAKARLSRAWPSSRCAPRATAAFPPSTCHAPHLTYKRPRQQPPDDPNPSHLRGILPCPRHPLAGGEEEGGGKRWGGSEASHKYASAAVKTRRPPVGL